MANEVRDTLFGDMEMADWPEGEAETEPWTSFVEARRVWGAGVIWERPDDRLDPEVNALLSAGRKVVSQIGPWDGARPDAPGPGHIRLNFLTPAGDGIPRCAGRQTTTLSCR